MFIIIFFQILSTVMLLTCASPSINSSQVPDTCLLGSVNNAVTACRALSSAYAGQVYFHNDTNGTAYAAEADGKHLHESFE